MVFLKRSKSSLWSFHWKIGVFIMVVPMSTEGKPTERARLQIDTDKHVKQAKFSAVCHQPPSTADRI